MHFPKVFRRQRRRNPVVPQCKTGRQLALSWEDPHVNSCGNLRFPSVVVQFTAGRRAHSANRWGFDGPSGTDPKTGGTDVTSYRRYRLHPRSSGEHDYRLSPSALPVFSQSIGSFKNTRRVRLSPAVDRVALQRLPLRPTAARRRSRSFSGRHPQTGTISVEGA